MAWRTRKLSSDAHQRLMKLKADVDDLQNTVNKERER